ncbi:HEAT repeat domain-containing protein [Rhodococcus kronopolitis]|uniref:HEAT repeat domain-containing protein n=1 Tax=Rhodococcus kronopolitis TaxID=1460226 RepID=A0ABV9FV60_9NOCA
MVVVNTTHHGGPNARLVDALAAADPSARLRAALAAGTDPDPRLTETLVERCAVEPDFFVRDMLTWALCRLPAEVTVPRLVDELGSAHPQARSQALHSLSKIGDRLAWPAVSAMLHDPDDEVARSAWRAAVALVAPDDEPALAGALVTELGRGDRDRHLSLSRALAGLGESVLPLLDAATTGPDPLVRAHAEATRQLWHDPDSGFALSLETAKRVAVTGPDA